MQIEEESRHGLIQLVKKVNAERARYGDIHRFADGSTLSPSLLLVVSVSGNDTDALPQQVTCATCPRSSTRAALPSFEEFFNVATALGGLHQ